MESCTWAGRGIFPPRTPSYPPRTPSYSGTNPRVPRVQGQSASLVIDDNMDDQYQVPDSGVHIYTLLCPAFYIRGTKGTRIWGFYPGYESIRAYFIH